MNEPTENGWYWVTNSSGEWIAVWCERGLAGDAMWVSIPKENAPSAAWWRKVSETPRRWGPRIPTPDEKGGES